MLRGIGMAEAWRSVIACLWSHSTYQHVCVDIIDSLEQSKDIETDLLERTLKGLTAVISGMKVQCYDRNDAYSELKEHVQSRTPHDSVSSTALALPSNTPLPVCTMRILLNSNYCPVQARPPGKHRT